MYLLSWFDGRPRRLARAAKHRTRFLWSALQFVVAAARGNVRELWLGDSHVAHFNDPTWPCEPLREVAPGRWVFWLGPKLMYSLASRGMPTDVGRLATALRIVGRPNRTVFVAATGEIDIRCHLVPRLAGTTTMPDFPSRYVANVQALAAQARAVAAAVVVPVPPSATYAADPEQFPVRGTLTERVAVHGRVREALTTAVAAVEASGTTPPLLLVDATTELSAPSGEIRAELTIDGCHTNDAGRTIVRDALVRALRSHNLSGVSGV